MGGQGPLTGLAKMAIPIGLSFINPVLGAVAAGALTAGSGLASGQGPLTSLLKGGIAGASQYGLNNLTGGGGPTETESTVNNLLADNRISQLGSAPLGTVDTLASQGFGLTPSFSNPLLNPHFFGGF